MNHLNFHSTFVKNQFHIVQTVDRLYILCIASLPYTTINNSSTHRRICEYTFFPPPYQPTTQTNQVNPNINNQPNINTRGCSPTTNGETISQRFPLSESNITMSSLDYAERIEMQPTSALWAEQVNMEDNISPSPPN